MEIVIPAIPAGVLTLLSFFAPYAVALLNSPRWSPSSKRLMAVVVPILLGLAVLALYFVMTGDTIPSWPVLLLLAVVVCQAAYALLRKSATRVEQSRGIQ